jgi:hypothetical protein
LTRGSSAIWRSIIVDMARVTASTSALTKFTVTGARDFSAGLWPAGALTARARAGASAPVCACSGWPQASMAAIARLPSRSVRAAGLCVGIEGRRCVMVIRSK